MIAGQKAQTELYEALIDANLPLKSVVDGKPRYSRELTAQEQITAQTIEAQYNKGDYDYLDNRVYPAIHDQLDMLYWDMMNNTTVWKDTITAIKEAYPKPTG